MGRKFLLLISIFLLFTYCNAQSDFIDSVKLSFASKPTIDLRFDTRNSFISNERVRIMGVKAGLDYNKRSKFGLSYNWLNSKLVFPMLIDDTIYSKTRLILGYMAPYFEYNFFKNRKWEISTLVSIGFGTSKYTFEGLTSRREWFSLYEPHMLGQYNLIDWFAVSFGIGYRLLLSGHKNLPSNFSSPIYVLKLKFILPNHLLN